MSSWFLFSSLQWTVECFIHTVMEKLLTLKLLLSWWTQPFQMGPGKMEYLILWQNLQILSFTKKTYKKIVKWSRKWQPEKYKIVQSKKNVDKELFLNDSKRLLPYRTKQCRTKFFVGQNFRQHRKISSLLSD